MGSCSGRHLRTGGRSSGRHLEDSKDATMGEDPPEPVEVYYHQAGSFHQRRIKPGTPNTPPSFSVASQTADQPRNWLVDKVELPAP
jgi:hypothetical protein